MNLSPWRIAALFSLCLASVGAHAIDCNKAATQADMNQCASEALRKADTELNRIYVQYRGRLDKKQQDQIRDVQLAWIKYRDLSCKYATSDTEGGSAYGMALQYCLADKTNERVKELKTLATCQEGDLSCPR